MDNFGETKTPFIKKTLNFVEETLFFGIKK